MTIFLLQILVSVLFFVNKVLWLMGKKAGWALGTVVATFAIFYFYAIVLFVYTAFEIGLVALMAYGFFAGGKKNPEIEKAINAVLVVTMLALTFFAFKGVITILELVSSTGLLFGTYFLSHGKNKVGWVLHFFAHLFATYMGFLKGQNIYAFLQFASVFVALGGILKTEE